MRLTAALNVFSFRPSRVAHPSALHSYALAPPALLLLTASGLALSADAEPAAAAELLSKRLERKDFFQARVQRVPAQGADVPATFVLYPYRVFLWRRLFIDSARSARPLAKRSSAVRAIRSPLRSSARCAARLARRAAERSAAAHVSKGWDTTDPTYVS